MVKFIREHGYAIYLGGALGAFVNVDYTNWQFYAIVVPLVFLVCWKASKNIK